MEILLIDKLLGCFKIALIIVLLQVGAISAAAKAPLTLVGSDTLTNLMQQWIELYIKAYPQTKIQWQATGSASAIPALIQGTSEIAIMSRSLALSEKKQFIEKYGYAPLEIKLAQDTIAVFVNKENRLNTITTAQLGAIFAANGGCESEDEIDNWQQLDSNLISREIILYGRDASSGTYAKFRQIALCAADFKVRVNQMGSSAAIVRSVSNSPFAIGYASFSYATKAVKPLAIKMQAKSYYLKQAGAFNRNYPLKRFLYFYINKQPNKKLSPKIISFIKLVLSPKGQERVEALKYISLSPDLIAAQLAKIGVLDAK